MKQYGTNGELTFEPFRELMVTLLGDAGTKDGMIESFKLLSGGYDHVKPEVLAKLLEDDEVQYLKTNAKPLEDGLDFGAWVEDVCSR